MNYAQVAQIIQSLPGTFQRTGTTFNAVESSIIQPCFAYTSSTDQLAQSMIVDNAQWTTLDTIGTIWGILRLPFEGDVQYRNRLMSIFQSMAGIPYGIQQFILDVFNLSTKVQNQSLGSNGAGYSITFSSSLGVNQQDTVSQQLQWIRPAGVPFQMYGVGSGFFLGTINYVNAASVTGAYLTTGTALLPFSALASTNSPLNQLPTTFLTNPLLTGAIVP